MYLGEKSAPPMDLEPGKPLSGKLHFVGLTGWKVLLQNNANVLKYVFSTDGSLGRLQGDLRPS